MPRTQGCGTPGWEPASVSRPQRLGCPACLPVAALILRGDGERPLGSLVPEQGEWSGLLLATRPGGVGLCCFVGEEVEGPPRSRTLDSLTGVSQREELSPRAAFHIPLCWQKAGGPTCLAPRTHCLSLSPAPQPWNEGVDKVTFSSFLGARDRPQSHTPACQAGGWGGRAAAELGRVQPMGGQAGGFQE